ncbi:MAG: thiopeptide-type bacteriocin biosynthesis protein [Arachidicoccus sp.]|nr:thiopeptide-type bacteriocin biosynthesis protein [Arachidicoccus sp.]
MSGSIPELLEELIVLQMLFTEKDANVIGADYFERRGIEHTPDKPPYLIPVRKSVTGTIPEAALKHLPELAGKLARLNGIAEPEDLKGFKTRFKHKFEGREVPLMVALDPELGVGYGNLEQMAESDDLTEKLLIPLNTPEKEPEAKRFLLEKADNNCFNGIKEIDLEDLFRKLPDNERVRLPNSFPALLKIVDDKVILEQMGGATANSLLGRFSLADTAIESHCSQIAELETKANPDVLFFDVAYMSEAKVDNINRRKQLYPLQLSILQYDTSAEPLALDDIRVSIKGDHILLRSVSRNQRLVPRIASAYNHTRSDLSLFRFLCDLQAQGLDTRLGFAPETYFPKQRYYPRITYKNIIVSPAQWAVKEDFLKSKTLSDYLDEIQVSRYFTVGNADQTLLFDRENEDDLQMLAFELGKKKKLFLKEAFLPENPIIKDRQGNGYNGELVVTLYHENRIYEPFRMNMAKEVSSVSLSAIIPPGHDWLYWELFCHPARANKILRDKIAPFLQKYGTSISSWFFIRYNEGGPHIRLRIQLKDRQDYYRLEGAFSESLAPKLQSGVVTDLRICTYKRETERYGADLITSAEQHFHKGSEYVLSLLDAILDDRELYRFCSETVHMLMAENIFPVETWEKLIAEGFEAFRQEHKLTPAEIKLLNTEFPHYRNMVLTKLNGAQSDKQQLFRQSFRDILLQCPETRRAQLFRDLLHMHVNRLFPENPRTHELVLYYLLDRELKMQKHLQQL